MTTRQDLRRERMDFLRKKMDRNHVWIVCWMLVSPIPFIGWTLGSIMCLWGIADNFFKHTELQQLEKEIDFELEQEERAMNEI